ncbi:MAG: 2-C-methyl-D-erythritol 4-phosphate cytidylyltransferase [Firmicutes bacterium]|nr:2-C-methyl-D-erythritol 4-phosphate cytidylyltransferase [Bacillota bacterium]
MNIAIILAAGNSTRLKGKSPKQLLNLGGKPVSFYSLDVFQQHPSVDSIVVVTKPELFSAFSKLVKKYHLSKVSAIIAGGASRQVSVFNALAFLDPSVHHSDIVLIHDAARPFITKQIIEDNIRVAKKKAAVETAISCADTISVSKNGKTISNVLDRRELFHAQTPQSFAFGLILKAHQKALLENWDNITDDAQLVLRFGHEVALVEGTKVNFKITTREDFDLAKQIVLKRNKH